MNLYQSIHLLGLINNKNDVSISNWFEGQLITLIESLDIHSFIFHSEITE